jgi:hypothetical protein
MAYVLMNYYLHAYWSILDFMSGPRLDDTLLASESTLSKSPHRDTLLE